MVRQLLLIRRFAIVKYFFSLAMVEFRYVRPLGPVHRWLYTNTGTG